MIFCTKCGTENPSESFFCYKCGSSLYGKEKRKEIVEQILKTPNETTEEKLLSYLQSALRRGLVRYEGDDSLYFLNAPDMDDVLEGAQLGDVESMRILAEKYLESPEYEIVYYKDGDSTVQWKGEIAANYWLNKAIHLGDPTARVMQIEHLLNKEYPQLNEAYELLEEHAHSGFPEAAYKIATLYSDNRLQYSDYDEAKHYLLMSFELGNSDSLVELGDLYYLGILDDNEYTFLNLYQRAADLDNSWGHYRLGFCYYYGDGVEVNVDRALDCWKKSAQLGNRAGSYLIDNIDDIDKLLK